MTFLQALIQHPLWQTLFVMFAVMVIERLWVWHDKYHPLALIRLFATNLARKVCPSDSPSKQQHLISGTLAIIVIIIPCAVVMVSLVMFAEFPLFFEGMMLLIALQFQPALQRFDNVRRAIKVEKKVLARDLLAPLVLRETNLLSPMGMAKAAIESVLLRFGYQYWATLFWFFVLGGPMALTYRIVVEMAQQWNSKLPAYRHFGKPSALLMIALAWLPLRLMAAAFALAEGVIGSWRARKNIAYQLKGLVRNHTQILALIGGALGIQLGGPAYYGGSKVRMAKVGGPREIKYADMQRIRMSLTKVTAILSTLCVLITAIMYSVGMGKVL